MPLFAIVLMAGCLPSADFKVSVRVIDQETGQPIPDAWVFVTAKVQAEPPFEEPYNEPLAGARAKTDSQGIANLKDIEGLSYRGEPQTKLWKAIQASREARNGKPPKRRIVGVEGGNVVVLAKGYGLLSAPFGIQDNAAYQEKLKKNDGVYHGFVTLPHYGEQKERVELDSSELAKGATITLKMTKADERGLMVSYCPGWSSLMIWSATSKETGASAHEKKAIYDYIIGGMAEDLDVKAFESCGGNRPSDWAKPEFQKEFMMHEKGLGRHDDTVPLWLTEKSLELLPEGYDEVKKYAEIIKGGVVAEEADKRDLNHYYNPYDTQHGDVALKWVEVGYPDNPNNDWGWQDALRYYREGDKGKAYKALGHVLKVLEDLSIPMRTHGIAYEAGASSKESKFEDYFAKLANDSNAGLPQRFGNAEAVPKMGMNPRVLFDAQAKLSFGKFDQGGQEINFDDYYAPNSVTKMPDNSVIDAMGEYLFPQAIANGAGLLMGFYHEVATVAEVPGDTTNQGGARADHGTISPKDAAQVKAMAKAVREADGDAKPYLIDVLGNVSSAAVHLQDAYRELLNDKDAGVQHAAIKAAGKLKMRDAAPKILRLLSGRKRYSLTNAQDIYQYKSSSDLAELNYHDDAIRALIELNDFDSVDEIISRDEFMSEMPGAALGKFGDKVLPKVIANASKGWAQRIGANSTISEMRDEAALPTLKGLLNGPDLEFAISAEDALSEIGKATKSEVTRKEIAAQLEKRFASDNKRLRTFAYRGLLNISPSEYGPRILKAFWKEDGLTQLEVLDAIAKIPPPGVEMFLEQFIKDDEDRNSNDQILRAYAARILFRATGRKVPYKGLEDEQKKFKDPYVDR